jgi:hypothetical protein
MQQEYCATSSKTMFINTDSKIFMLQFNECEEYSRVKSNLKREDFKIQIQTNCQYKYSHVVNMEFD